MHLALPKRIMVFSVLAALAPAVLVLAGCRMVGGNLVGVSLERGRPTTCIKQCNDAGFAKLQECKTDHETAREQCKLLPEPDRTECLEAASDARGVCNSSVNAEKQECRNNCHRQGRGSGG